VIIELWGMVEDGVHQPTTVDKPWGHELIWAKTERYVGKILHVRAGEALSLQYHRIKDETIMVLGGRLMLEYFAEGEETLSCELCPGEPFHVSPGLRHRMTAIEDTDVLEVSTPELDDVVRLEDRYGRAPVDCAGQR
jgi:mannose-6-phosphate isomerase-like protein (cupin superfamily)